MFYFFRPYHYFFVFLFSFVGIGSYAQKNTGNVKITYNKENIPVSVETSNPKIKNNIQKVYKGFYKNGKPYEGYFLVEAPELEGMYDYYQYYEKGELKKQYSYDFIKKIYEAEINNESLETVERVFDIETTFEDGKPKNGSVSFSPNQENGGVIIPIITYKDFKPQKIYLDIFAMHYGNRLMFEYHKQNIHISEIKENGKWVIKKKNNWIYIKSVDKDADVQETVAEGTPYSFSYYYIENGAVKQENFLLQTKEYDNGGAISHFWNYFPIKTSKTIEDFFDDFAQVIQKKESIDIEKIVHKYKESEQSRILSFMMYNEKGIAEEGCKVLSLSGGGYAIECYKEGKKVPIVKVKSLEEITEEKILNIIKE